jgi:uncharacterized protein
MAERVILKEIEKDFECVKEKTLGIVLFGSRADKTHHAESDIDVCLVAGEYPPGKLFQEVLKTNLSAKYDVKIFELLPLKLKGSILENHRVVWSRDPSGLSYYFYKVNRLWDDQKIALKKLGIKMFS